MAEDISTDLQMYGEAGVQTPNLNRLAEEGVLYTNAFATSSICSPNRSAMLVGVHQNKIAAQHHRSNRDRILPEPYKPITYLLRQVGYTTILGHHGVRGNGNKIDVNFKHQPLGAYNGKTQFGLFDKSDTLALADQPFFAQITLNVTHRGDWWDQIRNQSSNPVDPDSIVLPPYMTDHPIIRDDWARYLDQVEYMDSEVGMIMRELDEKGIADNTVIFFIGDNGRANIRGKGYLYDPGIRVPLIVRWPDQLQGGQVSNQLISTTDISASILNIAGANLPDYLTGTPFINTNSDRKVVFSTRDLYDDVLDPSRSVTTKRFKYIRHEMPWKSFEDSQAAYVEFYWPALHVMRTLKYQGKLDSLEAAFFDLKPREELYDLKDDPHETKNLSELPAYQYEVNRLKSMLDQWEAELPKSKPVDHDFVVPKAPELLQWIRYQRPQLYRRMLKGQQIRFGDLRKEFYE